MTSLSLPIPGAKQSVKQLAEANEDFLVHAAMEYLRKPPQFPKNHLPGKRAVRTMFRLFLIGTLVNVWCPLALSQLAIDLVVEGTTESTELQPGALVALNDNFDESNGVKYAAPLGVIPDSFVRPPMSLSRQDNELHDSLGVGGDHRIKADADHDSTTGDDRELADARIVVTGPVGTIGRWITNVTAASGDLRVWWFDGTSWVQVDGGINQSTFTPAASITLQNSGGIGRAEIPLKLEGLTKTTVANAITLEALFAPDGGGASVSDIARISVIDVDVEVNLSPDANDDYVTWGPTRCQMRVVGMEGRVNADGSAANLNVVLRNSPNADKWVPPQPANAAEVQHRIRSSGVPDDPGRFSGGRVRFASESLAVGSTAIHATHPEAGSTALLTDGSWHKFRIAGEFGRSSFYDKDTIIEACESTVDGRPFGSHRLMVRVRKQSDDLHSFEVQRLLEAMAISKDGFHGGSKRWPGAVASNVFNRLEATHTNARLADDEAHSSVLRQSAFLPWHRAFILQYERALQDIPGPPWEPNRYRAVSMHYWDWDEPDSSGTSSRRYTTWFLGRPNDPGLPWSTGSVGQVQFDSRNPVNDWFTPAFSGNKIRRRNHPALGSLADEPTYRSTRLLLRHSVFGEKIVAPTNTWSNGFLIRMEGHAHNIGHTWNCGGGQITNPAHSAKDPGFYLLHSQVDRQWAVWQNAYGRYQRDASGYDLSNGLTLPAGGNPGYQLGSHLNDKMWPWDATTGGGLSERPPGPTAPFSASGNPHLWPHAAVVPRCGDLIDYEGRADPDQNMGFCYDDVPFGRGTLEPAVTTGAGVRLTVTILGGATTPVGSTFVVRVGVVKVAPNLSGTDVSVGAGFNGTIRLSVVTGPPPDTLGPGTGVYITSGTGQPTATLADDLIPFSSSTGDFRVLSHTTGQIRLRAEQIDGGLPQTSSPITIN